PCRWTPLDRASLPDRCARRTGGGIHSRPAGRGVADREACWPPDSRADWKPMASGTSKAGAHEWLMGSSRQYLSPDQSFQEFLEHACGDLPRHTRIEAAAYVESFHACDASRISANALGRWHR